MPKRGAGARAPTPPAPGPSPSLLTGTLDSQFTWAQSLGHAIHSYLSNRTQNPIDADYVIFVAEVASTCNEALLMEYLLGKTTDSARGGPHQPLPGAVQEHLYRRICGIEHRPHGQGP